MLKKIGFLVFLLIISGSNLLYSYDGSMHKRLNEKAVDPANSKIDGILKSQLGLIDGIDTELFKDSVSKKIKEWIAFGGEAEDYGINGEGDFKSTRAYNHFHNPLEDWFNASLDNVALSLLYNHYYSRNPVSTVLWGLNQDVQDFSKNTTGDWSWGNAKEAFYIYLTGKNFEDDTIASTESERNSYFADCFRSLGQTMHLLEDMSVPLHTRNDVHIFPIGKMKDYKMFWNYETYTAKNIDSLNYSVSSGDKPDQALLTNPDPDPGYPSISPVSSLFDNNQYDGSTPLHNPSIGLAEYSNANFLTNDTMFNSDFPYPRKEDCTVFKDTGNNRRYIKIDNESNGEKVNHLAAVSWSYFWRAKYFPQDKTFLPILLDEECHREYASFLIPRAVGYSAALLDYFFRGKIELSNVQLYFDAGTRKYNSVTLSLLNITDNDEEMLEGSIDMVIKYKTLGQDDFHYVVKKHDNATFVPRDIPIDLTFDFGDSGVPITASSMNIYIVFRGKLNNEADALAVGYSDKVLATLFEEKWDNGLTGNHPWTHISGGHESGVGIAMNYTLNNMLVKENIRYNGQKHACFNSTRVSLIDAQNPNGILITPNTTVQYKIPEMSVEGAPPSYHWQTFMLDFNNELNIQISQDGQYIYINPTTAIYTFDPMYTIVDNIYNMFEQYEININEPLYLETIEFIQQLFSLPDPSTVEHSQNMNVDFIRIIGE